jgi:adenylyltransferase/sulfurtransferase
MGKPLIGRLLQFDALEMTFREFELGKDPQCPVCGKNPTLTKLVDYDDLRGPGGELRC